MAVRRAATGPGRRTAARTGDRERERPWWLAAEVPCGYCLQRHALHVAVRCHGCDGEVCRECVVIVRRTRQVFCPECAPEATS